MGWLSSHQLGTECRNWLWCARRGAATPAKHSKLCFGPKVNLAAMPFKKAEPAAPRWPAPGCCGGFCS